MFRVALDGDDNIVDLPSRNSESQDDEEVILKQDSKEQQISTTEATVQKRENPENSTTTVQIDPNVSVIPVPARKTSGESSFSRMSRKSTKRRRAPPIPDLHKQVLMRSKSTYQPAKTSVQNENSDVLEMRRGSLALGNQFFSEFGMRRALAGSNFDTASMISVRSTWEQGVLRTKSYKRKAPAIPADNSQENDTATHSRKSSQKRKAPCRPNIPISPLATEAEYKESEIKDKLQVVEEQEEAESNAENVRKRANSINFLTPDGSNEKAPLKRQSSANVPNSKKMNAEYILSRRLSHPITLKLNEQCVIEEKEEDTLQEKKDEFKSPVDEIKENVKDEVEVKIFEKEHPISPLPLPELTIESASEEEDRGENS